MFKNIAKKKHQHAVCFFQRSRLSLYIPARKEVAALDFPPTILNDVTVIDQDQFTKAVTKLLAQYKVDPGPVLIVLASDVCFTQEVEMIDAKTKQSATEVVKALRTSMPYTNVFARVIHQGKREIAVALNREFYEPLLAVFRDEKFDVTTLVPEFILSTPIAETGLTPEIAVQLGLMVDKLESFDLLESQEKARMITTSAQTPEDKKRTLMLVGVFTVLTLILVAVWWWTNQSAPPPKPKVPVVPAVVEQPALPVPSATPEPATDSASTASAELEALQVTGSGSATGAGSISATRAAVRGASIVATPSTRVATPSSQLLE